MTGATVHRPALVLAACLPALLAVLLSVSAAPVLAQSEEETKKAKALEKEAYQLFEAKDYLTAAQKLQPVHALLHHWSYLWNIGVALEKGGDMAGASAAFEQLVAHPEASAEKKAAAQAKLAQLIPKLVGGLALTCHPDDARFKATGPQGASEGRCPWRQEGLRVGGYTVDVSAEGYRTTSRVVEVNVGPATAVDVPLTKLVGHLVISSSLVGGQVELDGQPVGTTPVEDIEAPAGPHALTVTFPGKGTWEIAVELQADQRLVLHAEPPAASVAAPKSEQGTTERSDKEKQRAAAEATEKGRRSFSVPAWASAGVGVLAAGAGTLLWLHANDLHDQFEGLQQDAQQRHAQGDTQGEQAKRQQADSKGTDYARYQDAAKGCFIAAGVAAVASGALFVWDWKRAHALTPDAPSTSPQPTASTLEQMQWVAFPQLLPDGGGLVLGFAY